MTASTAEVPSLPVLPPIRSRRNPKWIALGITALCLGALGSFFLYGQLSQAQTVVAVNRTIYRGSPVQAADLTTVTVGSTPGIETIPAARLPDLVGQRAAFDLVAGSLVPPTALTSDPIPAPKRSVVGLRLVVGRAPTGGIPPGTKVRLVAIPPAGADPEFSDEFSGQMIDARVVSSAEGADGASVLNVDVRAEDGPKVGRLAAEERIVVVWDAES